MKTHTLFQRGLLLALPALFLHPGTLRADTLKVKTFTYSNVKVTALKDGKLYYKGSNGDERSAFLDDVGGLQLDRYPELAAADKAFEKEDFAGTAKILGPLVDKAKEDYVKIIAGAKLVACLDRSGQFEAAALRYAKQLQIDNGELTKSVKPESMPIDAADRNKIAAKLGEALKATADPIAKDYLTKTIGQLKSEAAAPVGGKEEGLTTKSNLLKTSAEARRDPIEDAIATGKAGAALDAIEKTLAEEEGVQLSKLYYQRGMALAALDKESDALVSYLRVAVHFPTSEYYGKSLLAAGKLYAKQKKTKQARRLLTEAQGVYGSESEEGKELAKLLASLPQP